LEVAFALPITVRVPGLRPCRAIVIYVGNRGGGGWNFASARRERSWPFRDLAHAASSLRRGGYYPPAGTRGISHRPV